MFIPALSSFQVKPEHSKVQQLHHVAPSLSVGFVIPVLLAKRQLEVMRCWINPFLPQRLMDVLFPAWLQADKLTWVFVTVWQNTSEEEAKSGFKEQQGRRTNKLYITCMCENVTPRTNNFTNTSLRKPRLDMSGLSSHSASLRQLYLIKV